MNDAVDQFDISQDYFKTIFDKFQTIFTSVLRAVAHEKTWALKAFIFMSFFCRATSIGFTFIFWHFLQFLLLLTHQDLRTEEKVRLWWFKILAILIPLQFRLRNQQWPATRQHNGQLTTEGVPVRVTCSESSE